MPTSEAPAEVNEPKGPAESSPQSGSPAEDLSVRDAFTPGSGPLGLGLSLIPRPSQSRTKAQTRSDSSRPRNVEPAESPAPVVRSSRWIDYDTHELLEMIGELEDERRWARLREGMLGHPRPHHDSLSPSSWIPRYLFKVPKVVDDSNNLKEQKDFTYLDTPPILQPAQAGQAAPQQPLIDKQTMEQMKSSSPPPPPPEQQPQAEQPKPQPSPPIPPSPQSQSQVEAPRPAAVPAKPNFAMGSQNPADQFRRTCGTPCAATASELRQSASGGLPMHPGPAPAASRFYLTRRAWTSATGWRAGITSRS